MLNWSNFRLLQALVACYSVIMVTFFFFNICVLSMRIAGTKAIADYTPFRTNCMATHGLLSLPLLWNTFSTVADLAMFYYVTSSRSVL